MRRRVWRGAVFWCRLHSHLFRYCTASLREMRVATVQKDPSPPYHVVYGAKKQAEGGDCVIMTQAKQRARSVGVESSGGSEG